MKNEKNELAKVLWFYGLIGNVDAEEQKIICPFHEDANPSMIVNLKQGSYYCFGCHESGDALKFVQKMEKMRSKSNDLQGCKKFFQILKSDECSRIRIQRVEKVKKTSKQMYAEAYDYFHGLSKVNWRKKSDLDEVNEVRSYMVKRGFTTSTLNKIDARVTFSKNYELIFPMLDNDKFKGWVCRTNIPEVEQKRKYLYNKGFRRKTSLIGNYGDNEVLFIVEGFMDRLKFIQFGVNNVVAILGWKASLHQIEKIKSKKNIKYIVSALDNDKCGIKGSKYLESIFKEKYVRFAYLKGVKDPGEMSKETFDKMYRKTMNKIDMKCMDNKKDGK
jgi:DNA primase